MKALAKYTGWDSWYIPAPLEEEFKAAVIAGEILNGNDITFWLQERDVEENPEDAGDQEFMSPQNNGGMYTVSCGNTFREGDPLYANNEPRQTLYYVLSRGGLDDEDIYAVHVYGITTDYRLEVVHYVYEDFDSDEDVLSYLTRTLGAFNFVEL